MLLDTKVEEICSRFTKTKEGEYGFSIFMIAAILSIAASLYSLYKNCNEESSYSSFRLPRTKRREDRMIKRVIRDHLPELDESQVDELKHIILDVVQNTTEEEFDVLTKELSEVK
jgi:hypothetical protein